MTKEFLNLAPGVSLEGRWRSKRPVDGLLYRELKILPGNLPDRITLSDQTKDAVVKDVFGCGYFTDYPLSVGQRNQVPIQRRIFPSLVGGPGNQGAFKELLSVDWYGEMLCLSYVLDYDVDAPSRARRMEEIVCFVHHGSENSIEVAWYVPDSGNPASPPGEPTSSFRYFRADTPGVDTGTTSWQP